MFQRQSRNPFPTRQIILLAVIVLGFLYFILSRRSKQAVPAAAPDTELPR